MKKIFLMTFLLMTTPVLAKQYTDYTFIGYEQEKPIVDEFTKYEEVYLHRFYSLKEGSNKMVDKYDPERETFDHCEKKPTLNKVYSYVASDAYENEKHVLIKAPSNGQVNEVKVENEDLDTLTIKKVEILIKDQLTYTIENEDINNQIFSKSIPNINVDDIEVLVYYETPSYAKIIFTLGGAKVSSIVNVEEGYGYSSFRALSPDKHSEFIKKYGFADQKFLHYYTYTEEKYTCYNDEKEYYKDSLESELEGYTYDPKEDITIYKVYKREEIEEKPKPSEPEEPDIQEPSDTPSPSTPDKPDNVESPETPLPSKPDKPNDTESEDKKDEIVKPATPTPKPSNPQKPSSLVTNTKTEDFEEDSPPTFDVDIDSDRIAFNDSNSNKSNTTSDDSNDKCESDDGDIKLVKRLILIVLLLSIVQTIQLICVNKAD